MKKLLIVEDNDIDRESLQRLVRRYKGFEVDLAGNVEEACSKSNGADVIVLDLKLPLRQGGALDQNAGRAVLDHIKSSLTPNKPIVVILSQFKSDDSEASAYHLSDFPFVKEWFHKADDREALSRFLSQASFQKQHG